MVVKLKGERLMHLVALSCGCQISYLKISSLKEFFQQWHSPLEIALCLIDRMETRFKESVTIISIGKTNTR